jgi:hypothetical protein
MPSACARNSGNPTAAPTSSPSVREIMKYAPPAPTFMLVAIAEIDSAVTNVMNVDTVTISTVCARPTLPRTHGRRRYMITPRIVRMLGVNTPLKVPKP